MVLLMLMMVTEPSSKFSLSRNCTVKTDPTKLMMMTIRRNLEHSLILVDLEKYSLKAHK